MTIEQQAIDFVISYEKKQGRNPKNISKTRKGFDIESSNRDIEVKGLGTKNGFILFNQYNFKALQQSNNFFLYIVYDIKNKPKLIIFDKNEILRRAKFYFHFEVPLRKADFDSGK